MLNYTHNLHMPVALKPSSFKVFSRTLWVMKFLLLGFFFVSSELVAQELVAPKADASAGPLRIGIALPFHAQNSKPNPLSEAMLDYYLGLKLGFQELEADGFQANISVWDTEPTDSLPLNLKAVSDLVKSENFRDQQILIGPVYEENFKTILQQPGLTWKTVPTAWISPLVYIKPSLIKVNENVSGTQSARGPFPNMNFFINDTLRYKSVAKNVVSMFPKHRICVVIDADKNNKIKGTMYKTVMQKLTTKLVTIHVWKNGVLTPPLPKRDSVVMAVCIPDATIRVGLEKLIEKRQQCWLVGDLGWFEDKRFYTGLNDPLCIYPTVNFTDYHDENTLAFSKKYFQAYGFEPSRFGFIGYDQSRFMGESCMAFGPGFLSMLPDATYEGLINSIHFKTGGTAPFNDGLRFVMISDETPHLFFFCE